MNEELDKILLSSSQPDFEKRIGVLRIAIIKAAIFEPGDPRYTQIRDIIDAVKNQGDEAISEFTEKYDRLKLTPNQFRVNESDLKKAHNDLEKNAPKLLDSLRQAITNVKKYQKEIFIGNKKYPGIKYTPIKRVGICVPGASAPLPSTVIMTAVPAQVAGVKEIAVVSPPRHNGSIHPTILAVCYELGIDEVYRIGGAQAVAALAFGTNNIKKVYKIVGPGNMWVQFAKRELFGMLIDIDSIAGPSEVLILANNEANPKWIAADMLSQAEHAPGSAILFTDSQQVGDKTLIELKKQVMQLNRAEETIECLTKYCGIVVFGNMNDAIELANEFASEHLEVQCGDESREIADRIENAGALFIGDYSPVAVGDYWAGPSHTLPTGMTAKFFSPLSANDFIKSTSIIEYDRKKLAESAADIIRLAEAEGLDAHAKSIRIRQQD